MKRLISVHLNSYKDSVRMLEATRAVLESPGVKWCSAFMATPANMETLVKEGFSENAPEAGANDLVVAVIADNELAAKVALATASKLLFCSRSGAEIEAPPRSVDLRSALMTHPSANVALISVPGPFATLEAQKALTAGLHVLLFSDNVPLDDEIALKLRAQELGRLVMGPGAGTAMLGGVGLGFANRVGAGPVGIVAAAGTGAQEVMSLLDRWDVGISHVIGVGGRDLSSEVGGITAEMAIRALDADPETKVILLVSKPPSPEVAERLLRLAKKPATASLIGLRKQLKSLSGEVTICDTLENGALRTLVLLGKRMPDIIENLIDDLRRALNRLTPERKRYVGLYCGGTLCYEAMTINVPLLGPIYSNIPIDERWTLDTMPPTAHVCLDLGDEEFTKGRPHPIIDVEARTELLRSQAKDPTVAAVVFDVVLGDGAHPDPASVLAPVAAEVAQSGAIVVVYVLGTTRDPQGFDKQCAAFKRAGCIVTATAARAALAAAALVLRDPSVAIVGKPFDPASPFVTSSQ